MTNFPALERAMHDWAREAIDILSSRHEPELLMDLRRWQRDSDGIFRDREREVQLWRPADVEVMRQLPSWQVVEQVFHQDDRLRQHLDTLVGTAKSGSRFDTDLASRMILPRPDETGEFESAFSRRYGRLDRLLGATEFDLSVVWPIVGLTCGQFPATLEPGLELDVMTDGELTAALGVQILPLWFPNMLLLPPAQSQQACLRYRYRLPKVLGGSAGQPNATVLEGHEERLQEISQIFEQVLALTLANPVAISGRMELEADWMLAGGVAFQTFPLTRAQQIRRLDLDEQTLQDIVNSWRLVRRPRLLEQQKALALVLRRLSYQAGRVRIEDELVDLLVAAEALYLSDVASTELGFRLALRSAAFANLQQLEMSRREVFDLMKAAYNVRSKIVHGDTPKAKDVKVKGVQVPLADFVQAVEEVIRDGLGEALRRATSSTDTWPPDWNGMTLP